MPNKIDHNKLWRITRIALNVAMGLIYLIIGYFVIEKQWFMTSLETNVSYALGSVLIVYGLYRIYRVYKSRE